MMDAGAYWPAVGPEGSADGGGARKGGGKRNRGGRRGDDGGDDWAFAGDQGGKAMRGKGKGKGKERSKGKSRRVGDDDGFPFEPDSAAAAASDMADFGHAGGRDRSKGKSREKGGKGKGKYKNKGGRDGDDMEGPSSSHMQPAVRKVDPMKARELLISWLMREHRMPRQFAESNEGIVESLTQQRGRGVGGPMYTCSVLIPALQLGPLGGMFASPKRKAAINAAYVAAVEELGIPVPPRAALSLKALQKMEAQHAAALDRAEALRNKQKLLAEKRAAEKAAARAEAERLAQERPKQIFRDKVRPIILDTIDAGDVVLEMPLAQQVVKGSTDRAEQRATSDLTNLCGHESALLEGPPIFIEKQEPLPGKGNCHFIAAVLRIRLVGGRCWAPVVGCAYGAKRGSVKSAAARQCLKNVATKTTLPVAAEMAEELNNLNLQLGHGMCPPELWAELCTAVSEVRKLEARGIGGIRLVVLQTAESQNPLDALSGPFRCMLTGRVPQDGGLREFSGASPIGMRSRRLAIATSCRDATSRLCAIFGGGDVTSWLRKMAITPMELEDLPREAHYNLWQLEQCSDGVENDVRQRLEAWSKARNRRGQFVHAPDLSQGPALAVPDCYMAPKGEGRDDPLEIAKRARGVPLLPVRSLRGPLAKILSTESILVVSGGTGSGKTTQLPQYIVDDWVKPSNKPKEELKDDAKPNGKRDEEHDREKKDVVSETGSNESTGSTTKCATQPVPEDKSKKEETAPQAETAKQPRMRMPCVVCTQPRRIAAISIAERVAWERGEELGDSVGYTVRNDARPPRKNGKRGTIEYCTVGILLRRLMDPKDPDLQRYTHILVDEVHERDLMTDFLLILLKELLVRRGDVRVILMSATLDVTTFTSYLWDCSVLEVPSGPRYPVEECYLDDLLYDVQVEYEQQQRMQALALMKQQQQQQQKQQEEQQQQQQSTTPSQDAAARPVPTPPEQPSWLSGTVVGGSTSFNPHATEFVPGKWSWAQTADSAAAASYGAEGGDATGEWDAGYGEEEEYAGEGAEGDENEDPEEEDDEEGEEDEAGEDEGEGEIDHVQAPRVQEYVSRDMFDLAQLLLKKEEASRRAFEMEQAEARAELQLAEGAKERTEGEEDVEDEIDDLGNDAMQGASTGLWWGNSEDGEALLDLCATLILHLVFKAATEHGGIFDDKGQPGSILVFLPGWAEIKSVMEKLQQSPRSEDLWILPLHSSLEKEAQQKIFLKPPAGKTKCILSTNIAESSVTIDDVLVVVDAGLMRELSYDPVRRLSTLETVWVSQSSSIQRKGRAGRVRNGRCYRLFSRAQFEATPWRTAPEMQRCELSASCLQALAMQREVRDFLSRAPDPPARTAVEVALKELVQLGAIAPAPRKAKEDKDQPVGTVALRERMLPLGATLSRMPLSPCLGRMLVLGTLFQCVDMACLLAAVISATRRPFVCPPGKRKESLAFQRGFDPTSDLLACYNAAEVFEEKLEAQARSAEESADRFALDRFLVPQRLRSLLRARDGLREELIRAGLVDRGAARQKYRSGEHDDADVGGWGNWEDEAGQNTGEGSWGRQGGKWWGTDETTRWQDPAWYNLHAHEGNRELLKALLVASSPTSVAMRRRPFLAKHRTPTGLEAIVAPQSVNAQAKPGGKGGGKEVDRRGGPSWWAYGSMQISNKQGFLRTTTMVDPYHIVLFGGLGVERRNEEGWNESRGAEVNGKSIEDEGDFQLEGLEAGGPISVIDDWIELQGSDNTVNTLSFIRDEIRRCVHIKVLDPSSPLPENSQWLLDEVATGVFSASARRQQRLQQLLPEQQVMPPGGSMKPTPPPHSQRDGGKGRNDGYYGGGRGRNDYGMSGNGGKGYGGDRWGGEQWGSYAGGEMWSSGQEWDRNYRDVGAERDENWRGNTNGNYRGGRGKGGKNGKSKSRAGPPVHANPVREDWRNIQLQ